MAEIIGVRFKEVGKIYYFDPNGENLPLGTPVVVETSRGVECGTVAIRNRQMPEDDIVKPLKKIIRAFASLQRNIPSMIWTFLLIMSFGIGTVVGTLALLITTCGFLIRSFIETIDEVGGESLEALQSVGAGRLSIITQVIIPASLPGFLSWLLYSLEVNIRSSTLVGAVGGGGIGLIMMGYIKQFRYHSAMGVILLVAVIVILVDLLTNYLRKKVLA